MLLGSSACSESANTRRASAGSRLPESARANSQRSCSPGACCKRATSCWNRSAWACRPVASMTALRIAAGNGSRPASSASNRASARDRGRVIELRQLDNQCAALGLGFAVLAGSRQPAHGIEFGRQQRTCGDEQRRLGRRCGPRKGQKVQPRAGLHGVVDARLVRPISAATSHSGTCKVTPEVHRPWVMLNSRTTPVAPSARCR